MAPRIFPGDCVVADPSREPAPGDIVVVRLADGRTTIKFYSGVFGGFLYMHGLCPTRSLWVRADSVESSAPVLERLGETSELYINGKDAPYRDALRRFFARGTGWFEKKWNYRPGAVTRIINGYGDTATLRRQIEKTFNMTVEEFIDAQADL